MIASLFRHAAAAALLAVPTLAVPALAAAADGPSFDCSKARGQVPNMICTDESLAALDLELSDWFAAALGAAGADSETAGEARLYLRAEQRTWLDQRDICALAEDPKGCVTEAYRERESFLVTRYGLKAPIGQAVWTCGEDPGEPVLSVFYDMRVGGLSLTVGNETVIGHQVISADGGRYALGGVREFWTRGDEAMLTWDAGVAHECKIMR